MPNFYQLSVADTALALTTNLHDGLSETEATARFAKFGANKLAQTGQRSTIGIFFKQFKSVLVWVLLGAGALSFYLQEYRDAVIMLLIVLANASIGFFQEFKSEKILASLKKFVTNSVKVLRDSQEKEITTEHLIPGDLVLLEEGDGVPADLRLMESNGFAVNEFILTGEQIPREKNHATEFFKTVPLPEQANCVFMGTTIARGMARGIVYATGMATEIGRIAHASTRIIPTLSPLQREIADLAKKITRVTGVVALLLFASRLFFHDSISQALVFAIGVAAATVPEGLPAQISVALSLGVGRLAKKNAIVKKLSSIETLGSATVIASDKTGTITKNEMTITHAYFNDKHFAISGTGYAPMGEIFDGGKKFTKENLADLKVFFLDGFLASTGRVHAPDSEHATWYAIGDPTECAFATLALKAGYDLAELDMTYSKLALFPFDSERKRMSIVRAHKDQHIVFAKGSIETILAVATSFIDEGKIVPLTDSKRKELLSLARVYSSQSLRVLAVAYKDLEKKAEYQIVDVENNLTFAGLVTMVDPPHAEVKQALSEAFAAHLRMVMITGDNAATALAVANTIGMTKDSGHLSEVIEGATIEKMTDAEIQKNLDARAVIFSRVSPEDKLRIVRLLKARGDIVAVTGDGVNDTLSLKQADIGVAMGEKGAEVVKETASLILLDDNFSTIVLAIREGRTIYRNLEKTITSSLTSNFGELFCMLIGFVGAFFGLPIPIVAVQILAVDLVGEMLPLTFLTFDPPDENIMRESPRDQKAHIVTGRVLADVMLTGLLMGALGFVAFYFVYVERGFSEAWLAPAQTATYVTIVFCQFANILARRTSRSIFNRYFFSNKNLLLSFFISILFVLLIVYVPLVNEFLHTAPLTFAEWSYPLAGAAVFLVVAEIRKLVKLINRRGEGRGK